MADPRGVIYHMTSVSPILPLLNSLPLSLSRFVCLPFSSSPAEHSVISHSLVGAGSKSAQLDHGHQSQPALRMGHL